MIDWPNPERLECVRLSDGAVFDVLSVTEPNENGARSCEIGDGTGFWCFWDDGKFCGSNRYQIRNKAPTLDPSLAAELLALPNDELRARLQAMVPVKVTARSRIRELLVSTGHSKWSVARAEIILTIAQTLVNEGLIRKQEEGR